MEAVTLYPIQGGTPTALALQVKSLIDKNGMTITELAKEINYSRPALSQYLSGKYPSDPSEIEQAIANFIASQGGEVTVAERPTVSLAKPAFIESRDATAIIGACQSCQAFTGLGIVVGKSGFGKTHTLKYYARSPKVAYIECDDTMGQRDLVKAIEKSLGLPISYGTIWERVNGIREFFNCHPGYLLIIDEADKLVSKYSQKKMEILRAIFDQSDVGMIIAGEPKLEAQIKSYISRFANRVDFYVALKGLSSNEVRTYLGNFNFEEDAIHEMVVRATNNKNGCFRLLDRTLNNILRVLSMRSPDTSGGTPTITTDMIAKASNMMML
ncbi:AAA family ATPase [Paenibacillus sp. MSJ-34]|uniref:AAA family ATPase n=1 Tax=Paenibacillus sp. MSJ-34 TaxID=2841529 RepID=UPI001C1201F7|nr:AAA family ATPase [Paenibacillus sp. MSJ-34]MBU5442051.1 AAA family ATPase [Paenibacillus sp. MSJ-34]